jgi:hypothetical protein
MISRSPGFVEGFGTVEGDIPPFLGHEEVTTGDE